MEKRGVARAKVLYEDRECCEVVRRDYNKYSALEFDFIFCDGCDEELRGQVISLLRGYKKAIVEAFSHAPKLARLVESLIESPEPGHIIPHIFCRPASMGVGKTIIYLRLPREVINALIEAGIIDIVREWCEKRKREEAPQSTSLCPNGWEASHRSRVTTAVG